MKSNPPPVPPILLVTELPSQSLEKIQTYLNEIHTWLVSIWRGR